MSMQSSSSGGLYIQDKSSIYPEGKFGNGTVVAHDWHDHANDEHVLLVVQGYHSYTVYIVKEVAPLDGSTWDVLYYQGFPSIELAISGQMEPAPYSYSYDGSKEARPWQAGYLDCKER